MSKKYNRPWDFAKIALTHFKDIGGVFPSSSFAARAVAQMIAPGARIIVEYGPGAGAITKDLLSRLAPHGKLIGIELHRTFISVLAKWNENRLQLIEGDVVKLTREPSSWLGEPADAVVSGIPLALWAKAEREKLVKQTYSCLKNGGCFVVYQNTPKDYFLFRKVFQKVKVRFEPRNVPPYFIMVGIKI